MGAIFGLALCIVHALYIVYIHGVIICLCAGSRGTSSRVVGSSVAEVHQVWRTDQWDFQSWRQSSCRWNTSRTVRVCELRYAFFRKF